MSRAAGATITRKATSAATPCAPPCAAVNPATTERMTERLASAARMPIPAYQAVVLLQGLG